MNIKMKKNKLIKSRKFCIECSKLLGKSSIYLPIFRCRSCEAKRKHRQGILNNKGKNHPMYGIKGYKNPLYGTKRPDTSKRMKLHNPNKNRIYSKKERKIISARMKEIYTRPGVKEKLISSLKGKIGKDSRNWIDGRSFLSYPREFTKILKKKIRERDNYTCQNCGMTEKKHLNILGVSLHIHHIDYNKQNCKENNLITLCNQCNTRANKNRVVWQTYYSRKINNA